MYDNIFEHFLDRMGEALDKDTRGNIIKRTLANHSKAKLEHRKKFDQFINLHVVVKGFRNAFAAPTKLLANEILKHTNNNHFLHIIILSWIDFWPEASGIAEQLLSIHLPDLTTLEKSNDEGTAVEKINDFISLAVEKLTKNVNCTAGEATVLICEKALQELSGESPVNGEDELENDEDELENDVNSKGHSLWDKFLEEAGVLSADSPEWGNLGQFIASLQKLAEKKAGQIDKLLHLEEALSELRNENKDDLSYFNLESAALWEKDKAPVEKAEWLVKQIGALRKAMQQHREIENSPNTTVVDARRQRKQLTDLERVVADKFGKINAVLGTAVDTDTGVKKEAAPEHETDSVIGEAGAAGETKAKDAIVDQVDIPVKTEDVYVEDSGPESGDARDSEMQVSAKADENKEGNTQSCTPIVEETDEEKFWSDYCWEMLKLDDLAGAYWLCASLETQGKGCPVPGWLLQAVQGARWMSMDSGHLVDDLARIARDRLPGNSDVEELLGLAASLRPAVIAPAAGMLDWLKTPGCSPAFNGLVQAVKEFAHYGKALHSSDLRNLEGVERFEEDIKLVVENCD